MAVTKIKNNGQWILMEGGGSLVRDTLPIGSINLYGGVTPPTGWLLCNGSAISRTTFAELFAAIGISFGSGDGSTTFNLPNFQDNVAVGAGHTYALGATGGEANHILTVSEMPSHTHEVNTGGYSLALNASAILQKGWYDSGLQRLTTQKIQNTGGSSAHNNMQPFVATNYIIKAFNIETIPIMPAEGNIINNLNSTSVNDALSANMGNVLNTSITNIDSKIPFSFGIDANGNYGYKKAGADTVYPFSSDGTMLYQKSISNTNTTYTTTQAYRRMYVVFDTNTWGGSILTIGGVTYYSGGTNYKSADTVFYASGNLGLIGYIVRNVQSGTAIYHKTTGYNQIGIVGEAY